jgi:hypothetical protein
MYVIEIVIHSTIFQSPPSQHLEARSNHSPILLMIVGVISFVCIHLVRGMVSSLHIMIVFAAMIKLLEYQPISDDVLCDLIMQSITLYDLPPMTSKH